MSVIGSNILAGASGQGGGYTIENSLRFRSSASAYLSRTFTTPTDTKKFTWSGWVKRGTLGGKYLFGATPNAYTDFANFGFANASAGAVDSLTFDQYVQGSGYIARVTTSAVYRDPSAWYHIVLVWDSANATAANRVLIYVNGSQVTSFSTATYPAQNTASVLNATNSVNDLGNLSSLYFDGYMAEVNFIDGQALTPSDFGNYNEDTGVWQPAKYAGSYGTNGFYLPFSDNTTTTTLAADASGNGNDWTPNNISLTAGATYDSMTDTPTPYADGGNYAVLNPLEKYSGLTIADGNLKVTSGDNTQYGAAGTLAISSGKWYYEAIFSNASLNNMAMGLTTTQNNVQTAQWAGSTGMFMCGNFVTGTAIHVAVDGSYTQVSTTLPAAGSYLVCAVDYDNGKAWFGTTASSGGAVTWYPASTGGSVGDPVAGINPTITFSTTYPIRPFMGSYGAGLNWIANFGQRPFITTAPSGFNAWSTYNLPDSAIVDGSEYFDVVTRTGTGAEVTVTGLQFQPDLLWTKTRSNVVNHSLTSTGLTYNYSFLQTNTTEPENTSASQYYMIPTSDGYTVGTGDNINQVSRTFVDWVWKKGATQGFDIVTFANSGGGTFSHSLGVKPSMMIVKNRTGTADSWLVYHSTQGATKYLRLESTSAAGTSSAVWSNTEPTSTQFTVGSGLVTGDFIGYLFADVEGYSKFGSYTGNGSADGPFVYTGFRPKFVMIKSTSSGGWSMTDTSRDTYNLTIKKIEASSTLSEAGNAGLYQFDVLSNGFKLRQGAGTGANNSGQTYIYMAFAENPFKNSLAR